MPIYKTYNQMYEKGKKTGNPFIYHKNLKAKSMKDAKAKIDRTNREWSKQQKRSGYSVKTHKVVLKAKKKKSSRRKPRATGFGAGILY